MKEKDWKQSSNVRHMLALADKSLGTRKRLLFAVACCRAVEPLLEEHSLAFLALAEEFADGHGTLDELREAAGVESEMFGGLFGRIDTTESREIQLAGQAVANVLSARHVTEALVRTAVTVEEIKSESPANRLRDIVGNPFRKVAIDPAWLAWNRGAIQRLTSGIYAERRFSEVPLLADALTEAGCSDAELLGHLRDAGPHVRGCWALDLLLGFR